MKDLKSQLVQTNQALKVQRVGTVLKQLGAASRQNIENRIMKYRSTRIKFEQLLDIGDNSTTDIACSIREIDPEAFVNKIDALSSRLVAYAVEIKRCICLHKQLFPDVQISDLDDSDLDGIKELFNLEPVVAKNNDSK